MNVTNIAEAIIMFVTDSTESWEGRPDSRWHLWWTSHKLYKTAECS